MSNTNNPIELLIGIAANKEHTKKSIQSTLDSIKNDLKLDITVNASNVKKEVKEVNNELAKVGNSTQITEIFKKEFKNVKDLTRELDKYLSREMGEYKLDFDVKGAEQTLKSITAKVRDEAGNVEKIVYQPKLDVDGVAMSLQPIKRELLDISTKGLDLNIDDAIAKLTKLKNEGKLTSDQFKVYEKEIKNATDNLSLDKVLNGLNKDVVEDSGLQKWSSVIKDINRELQKLKDIGQLSNVEFKRLQQEINSLDEGDIRSAQAQLEKMKDRTVELERAMSLEKGFNKQRNSLIKLESDLIRIRNLYGKSFSSENSTEYGDISGKIQKELLRLQTPPLDPVLIKNSQKEVDVLTQKVRRLGAEATQASRSSMGIVDAFKIAMQRFPVWINHATVQNKLF